MKHIKINNCGECPYTEFRADGNMTTFCLRRHNFDTHKSPIVDRESIDKDCPLEDYFLKLKDVTKDRL